MKKYVKRAIFFLLAGFITLAACKKNKVDPGNPATRTVKYEITGNFSGKLTIVYNDNVNGNTVLNNISLPWTRELTYTQNVAAIGIQAQAASTGMPGQTATMKIYAAGKPVKSSAAVAGALGEMVLPAIAHVF